MKKLSDCFSAKPDLISASLINVSHAIPIHHTILKLYVINSNRKTGYSLILLLDECKYKHSEHLFVFYSHDEMSSGFFIFYA